MDSPTTIGSVSEGMVLAALLRSGYNVLLPFGGGLRYDMAFDDGTGIQRVQIKTGRVVGGSVQFSGCSVNRDTGKRSGYQGQAEFFGVHCPANRKCYLVPVEGMPSNTVTLRVDPPGNGQVKGIRLAQEFEI